jgi:hypothetical protein
VSEAEWRPRTSRSDSGEEISNDNLKAVEKKLDRGSFLVARSPSFPRSVRINPEDDDRHKRESVTRDGSRLVWRVSLFTNHQGFINRFIRSASRRSRTQVAMPSTETETPTPELMLAFYRRLYPFKSIFKWLNHEHTPSRLFTHREISFTLQNDVYLRYHSFTTADEFKKQTCTLNPTRFEIGPVYTARVRV